MLIDYDQFALEVCKRLTPKVRVAVLRDARSGHMAWGRSASASWGRDPEAGFF